MKNIGFQLQLNVYVYETSLSTQELGLVFYPTKWE